MSACIKVVAIKRKLLVLAIIAAGLVALSWYLKNHVTLEQLVAQETHIREVIAESPWSSFGIGFVIYACVSLIPGTSGKSVVYGWLYGFWQGLAIIILGLTAAAMMLFYLSRYVFRGWIEHRYGKFLTVLNKHLKKEGGFYLLSLRMAHFPFTISISPVVPAACRAGLFAGPHASACCPERRCSPISEFACPRSMNWSRTAPAP